MSHRLVARRPVRRRQNLLSTPPALERLENRLLMIGSGASAWDWSMPSRYGDQLDSAGLPVIPNTRTYAFPNPTTLNGKAVARFPVKLQSTGSGGTSYAWSLQGQGIDYDATTTGKTPIIDLPEGTYHTTLSVTKTDGSVVTSAGTVNVHNLLYVAIGDSYSSGEGNPHVGQIYDGAGYTTAGAQWASSGTLEEDRYHRMTHRSAKAGTAQAALAMENADPKTSVTFVFLSHTGSTIYSGVLNQRETGEPDIEGNVPAQLDRLGGIIGNQHIDGMTVSIGGNDIGFADILVDLLDADIVLDPVTYESDLDDIFEQAQAKIAQLGSTWYPELAANIRDRFDVGQVFLTEYPDITKDTTGDFADELLGDVLPGLEVNNHELKLMAWRAMIPLSDMMRDAASSLGWTFVDGIAAGTGNGGYGVNLRTALDSVYLQGPLGSKEDMLVPLLATARLAGTLGTMHPIGHALDVVRDRLFAKMNEADLQVSDFSVSGGAFTPGANGGTYTITIRNGALAGTSAATTADLQLSTDDDVWNDLPILSFDVPELAAGGSITFTGSLPVFADPPRPAGNTYWVAPVVDPGEGVEEGNENNNSGTNSGRVFQTRIDADLLPVHGASDATIDPKPATIDGTVHGVLGLDEVIGARDVDAFKFNVFAGQRIDFTLTGGLNLRLFRVTTSPVGGYVLASETPVGGSSSGALRHAFAAGGTYVAVVAGQANGTASPGSLEGRVAGPMLGYDLTLADTTPAVWDGGAGTMLWTDARNWTRDVLPLADDEVHINLPVGQTVIVNGNAVAAQLISTGGLAINSGKLTIGDAATLNLLSISGGTLDGGGTVSVGGAFSWVGGSMLGGGTTILNGVSTIGPLGSYSDEFIGGSRTLRIAGLTTLTSSRANYGLAAQTATARIEVADGGRLALHDNAQLYGAPATLVVEHGGTLAHGAQGYSETNWSVQVHGTVTADDGTLRFVGPTTVRTGGSVVPAAGAIRFHSASSTIDGSIGGSGNLFVDGGQLDINGAYALAGTLGVVGGVVNVNAAATLAADLGGLSIGGSGTLNLNSGDAATFATYTQLGGTLGGSDTTRVGLLDWRGGRMRGAGSTVVVGGGSIGSLGFGVDERLADGRRLRLEADTVYSSNLSNYGLAAEGGDARIEVAAGATLTLVNNAGIGGGGSALVIEGGATLEHVGTGVGFVNVNVRNDGTIRSAAGTLNFAGANNLIDGSLVIAGGAKLGFTSGTASLQGNGTATGPGAIEVAGGTVTVRDGFDVRSSLWVAGTFSRLNVDANIRPASLSLAGGAIGGSGTITVSGDLTWDRGTMDGTGTTIVKGATTIGSATFNSDERMNGSRTLRLEGNASLAALAGNYGLIADADTVRIEVADGATLALGGSVNVSGFGTMLIEAGGTLAVGGGGARGLAWNLTNRGRIALTNGGDLNVQPRAGNFFNNEGRIELSAGSVLNVNGNVRFAGASPSIKVSLAGGASFGQLSINGSLDLGATAALEARLVGAYDPIVGARHNVMTASGGVTGAVAAFAADATPAGRSLVSVRPSGTTLAVDVSATAAVPHVVGQAFEHETRQAIILNFDADVSASLGRDDLIIRNLTTGQVLSEAIGTIVWDAASKTAVLNLTGQLADGRYELTLVGGGIVTILNAALVAPTTPLTFDVLAGDVNRDGAVGFDDLLALAQNYGTSGRSLRTGNVNYTAGGGVDFDDLLLLAQQYGKTLPTLQGPSVAAAPTKAKAPAARRA